MAQVPKIDTPCPLGIDEQRRINGHCARCDEQVHRLDTMSDGERQALLATANGPICVAYRSERPRATRRGAGFGIAIAATLVSVGAYAADPPTLLTQPAAATPVASTPLLAQEPAKDCDDEATEVEWIEVMGGVKDPRDAHWVDDSELPELPMRKAATLDDATAAVDAATVANPVSAR